MNIFAKDGPGAMEKMIANMLGFTPEDMAKTLTDFRDMILTLSDRLKRIEEKQDLILAMERTTENDNGSERPSGDGNGKRLALASPDRLTSDGERNAA